MTSRHNTGGEAEECCGLKLPRPHDFPAFCAIGGTREMHRRRVQVHILRGREPAQRQ